MTKHTSSVFTKKTSKKKNVKFSCRLTSQLHIRHMEWPSECGFERDILKQVMKWDDERVRVVRSIRDSLVPVNAGSTSNPFFLPNRAEEKIALSFKREVDSVVPSVLVPLYQTYGDSMEFVGPNHIIFLSESEMRERRKNCGVKQVDFSFQYEGMGHVMVHAYDHESDCVMSFRDGGGDGFSRELNARTRRDALREGKVDAVPFCTWWDGICSGRDPSPPPPPPPQAHDDGSSSSSPTASDANSATT